MRAIRRYRDDPVPIRDVHDILFAATRGPSGSNRQPFRCLVLTDGANARAAKAFIGEQARGTWHAKRSRDGYDHACIPRDERTRCHQVQASQGWCSRLHRPSKESRCP